MFGIISMCLKCMYKHYFLSLNNVISNHNTPSYHNTALVCHIKRVSPTLSFLLFNVLEVNSCPSYRSNQLVGHLFEKLKKLIKKNIYEHSYITFTNIFKNNFVYKFKLLYVNF